MGYQLSIDILLLYRKKDMKLTRDEIKHLTLRAIVSDDKLFERLVLKGGNALALGYKLDLRASEDIDFSISRDFSEEELNYVTKVIEQTLTDTFAEKNYEVFNYKFQIKPKVKGKDVPNNWGGYKVSFKVCPYGEYKDAQDKSRHAGTPFEIEISKHEYCEDKALVALSEEYMVYVYTPDLIACEKLRAICQQHPDYIAKIGKSYNTARARDFYDIYQLYRHYNVDLTTPKGLESLRAVFAVKDVDLSLLLSIGDSEQKEFHRADFENVKVTVTHPEDLKDYEFYYDFIVNEANKLSQALGIIQSPS